jgi:hypothetical protein
MTQCGCQLYREKKKQKQTTKTNKIVTFAAQTNNEAKQAPAPNVYVGINL